MKGQRGLKSALGILGFCLVAASGSSPSTATAAAQTSAAANDILVKFKTAAAAREFSAHAFAGGAQVETLGSESLGLDTWVHVKMESATFARSRAAQSLMNLNSLSRRDDVVVAQPNFKVQLLEDNKLKDPAARARLIARLKADHKLPLAHSMAAPDNPPFPNARVGGSGPDTEFAHQWGMIDIGLQDMWKQNGADGRGKGVLVAVIDTGVDYTHPDLVDNMYINPGESGLDHNGQDKSSNNVDDDSNGFIDDVQGWDFASDDNKPYDLAVDPIQILMGGGNPGHGTHCAGNVAAVANNGRGISGVAPEATILPIRFLNEKGQGDTAKAVKAINYAILMGAKVLSNSWGSEGEESMPPGFVNQALRDAIVNAEKAGALFVAAAGNGHQGTGYDNDTDAKPGYPASYNYENIVSVAAINKDDQLGPFSNWGAHTVHLAAPGVEVFSTTVGGNYSDVIVDLYGLRATWDGTSMACPHVAGAAAAYWSKHPNATYKDVKAALISSAKPIAALQGKSVSGGKLNLRTLLQ